MREIAIMAVLLLLAGGVRAQQFRIQKSTNRLYGIAKPKGSGSIKWIVKPVYSKLIPVIGNREFCYAQSENGRWGVISMDNEMVLPAAYSFIEVSSLMSGNFSAYVKRFVEDRVNVWQQKGEFEKTADYKKRVNADTREAKVQECTAEAKKLCLKIVALMDVDTTLGSYDPDNETYLVETGMGNIVVPVPISAAPAFKEKFPQMTKEASFDLYGWTPGIRQMAFKLGGKTMATYRAGSDAKYARTDIKYSFDPIVIAEEPVNALAGNRVAETKTIEIGKPDVDIDIPYAKASSENTFAVVIANEDYQDVVDVPNAINDGEVFAEYCNKTLGLPENNIRQVKNATFNNLKRAINWLQQISDAYDGDVRFIVYYAGHGIPDEKTQSAYLLPVDGLGNDASTGYSLKALYEELNKMNAESVVVFIDACFSGATRDGGMMMAARGIVIKAKQEAPMGNLVVLTAAQGDETAYPYADKRHGLFTYYLLKKLQETKGRVTLGELSVFIKENVQKKSVVVNGKPQTPTVTASYTLGDRWKSWQLK